MLKDCPSIHCLPTSVLGLSLWEAKPTQWGVGGFGCVCLGGPRRLNVTPDYLVDLRSHLPSGEDFSLLELAGSGRTLVCPHHPESKVHA